MLLSVVQDVVVQHIVVYRTASKERVFFKVRLINQYSKHS